MAVEPLLLPAWHLLASVEEEYNAVYLRCASSGDLSLFGKGAGALPTATAVLGDLIDLAQDNSVQWPAPQRCRWRAAAPASSPPPRRHYLRVDRRAASRPRAPHREPGAPCRADGAESRQPRRRRSRVPGVHDLAEPRRANRAVRAAVARLGQRRTMPVSRGPRVSGCRGRGSIRRAVPPERPPLEAMADETRRLHEALDAHARRTGLAVSQSRRAHRAAGPLWIGAHDRAGRRPKPRSCLPAKAAGRSCRISTRATARRRPRQLIARSSDLEHAGSRAGLRFGDAGDGAGVRRA